MCIDKKGNVRKLYLKRRDILRIYKLHPRDYRRIDGISPISKQTLTLHAAKNVLLVNLGGIRMLISTSEALIFEP